jgi:hypothetical protein
MRRFCALGCSAFLAIACYSDPPRPLSPTPQPAPQPAPPPPAFPTIAVGEVVRLQFTVDDVRCVGGGGVCRSYVLTAPSSGRLEVVVTSVSGEDSFVRDLEMYVVPGADDWIRGPGARISAIAQVSAGFPYEIRMYSGTVPSLEFELRTSLR